MKFMMLMIPAVYQGGKTVPGFTPDPKKIEEMDRFNQELGKAFTIESLNGLHPLAQGARVSFAKGKSSVTDGPFIETKEVVGGYWLVEAPSKEEVVKWAQRCPADEGDTIEIRQVFGPEVFEIGSREEIRIESDAAGLGAVAPRGSPSTGRVSREGVGVGKAGLKLHLRHGSSNGLLLGRWPRPAGRRRQSLRRSTRPDGRFSRRCASPLWRRPERAFDG